MRGNVQAHMDILVNAPPGGDPGYGGEVTNQSLLACPRGAAAMMRGVALDVEAMRSGRERGVLHVA